MSTGALAFLIGNPAVAYAARAAGWALVCWVVVWSGLGSLALTDPDEAHYAAITREMVRAGTLLVPILDGAPYIDKPVLFHWLQAAAFELIGETEFAARLPSAIAALCLLAITAWFGRRVFGPEIGERAALVLATVPATFALARLGIFDMLFSTFLFGALACLALAALEGRRAPEWIAYILLAAAVLTKGPVALVLFGLTFLGCLLFERTRTPMLRLRWVAGLALVIVVSAPWFLWMWHVFGDRFVDDYLLTANVRLFAQPLYRTRFDPFFYGPVFLLALLPWSPIVLGALADLLRKRLQGVTPPELLLWIWIVVVVGFFSFSRFKLDTYIYPAAPAAGLLVSLAWQRARESCEGPSPTGVRVGIAVIPLVLCALGVSLAIYLLSVDLPISAAAIVLPLALVGGGFAFTAQIARAGLQPPRLAVPLLAALLCVYGTVVSVGFPLLDEVTPSRELGRTLVATAAPDDRLAIYQLSKWQASLRYYADRPVIPLETPEEVAQFFTASGRGYCVMRRADLRRLRNKGLSLRPLYGRPAVTRSVGGRGLRRQRWAEVVVVAYDAAEPTATGDR